MSARRKNASNSVSREKELKYVGSVLDRLQRRVPSSGRVPGEWIRRWQANAAKKSKKGRVLNTLNREKFLRFNTQLRKKGRENDKSTIADRHGYAPGKGIACAGWDAQQTMLLRIFFFLSRGMSVRLDPLGTFHIVWPIPPIKGHQHSSRGYWTVAFEPSKSLQRALKKHMHPRRPEDFGLNPEDHQWKEMTERMRDNPPWGPIFLETPDRWRHPDLDKRIRIRGGYLMPYGLFGSPVRPKRMPEGLESSQGLRSSGKSSKKGMVWSGRRPIRGGLEPAKRAPSTTTGNGGADHGPALP